MINLLFLDRDHEDKDKYRRDMEDKLKKIGDFEDQMRQNKAEETKRDRDEMLKWAKQLKRVCFWIIDFRLINIYSKKN